MNDEHFEHMKAHQLFLHGSQHLVWQSSASGLRRLAVRICRRLGLRRAAIKIDTGEWIDTSAAWDAHLGQHKAMRIGQ